MKRLACLIVLSLLHVPLASGEEGKQAGFVSLFNGRTLTGWTGAVDGYRVEDGNIVCLKGGSANLLTVKQYSDFVLRFEVRLTPGANNGLAIRSPLKAIGNLHLEGIELQILDNSAEKFKDLKKYQYHGSVYGVVPAKRGSQKPVGEWNEQEVTVKGRHIKVVLNGATIVDANLDEASKDGTLDGAEHPGLQRTKGHIGFLGHGDRIEVRKIRIKEL
jgi:hypothetical protein